MEDKKETAPGAEVQEQNKMNFNPNTGEKLHHTCPNCWIKHKPYNCGHEKCIGRKLIAEEAKNAIDLG